MWAVLTWLPLSSVCAQKWRFREGVAGLCERPDLLSWKVDPSFPGGVLSGLSTGCLRE